MNTTSIPESLAEIEAVAPLQALQEKYARLSRRFEMEGNHAAAGACDMACIELESVIKSALQVQFYAYSEAVT